MPTMRRILYTVLISGLLVVLTPTAASAHSVAGAGPTDYKSTITGISPQIPGIRIRIVEVGSRIELANHTKIDAIVLGYQQEPYLRIGPSGTFQNTHSPATYLNRTRNATTSPPPDANPTLPPHWQKVSDSSTARWHDHRTHWMTAEPSFVKAAPNKIHVLIPHWIVPVSYGSQTIEITGRVTWQPGPSGIPWYLSALVIAGLVAFLLILPRTAKIAFLVTMLLVVTSDVVYRIGIIKGIHSDFATVVSRDSEVLTAALLAWVAGILSVILAARHKTDWQIPALFAAFLLFAVTGIGDFSTFNRSQIPSGYSASFTRALVAVVWGLSAGLVVALARDLIKTRKVDLEESISGPT